MLTHHVTLFFQTLSFPLQHHVGASEANERRLSVQALAEDAISCREQDPQESLPCSTSFITRELMDPLHCAHPAFRNEETDNETRED